MNLDDKITVSFHVKRDTHVNGMTLKEYADGVIAGTQPILKHDEYHYQFDPRAEDIEVVTTWATNNDLSIEDVSPTTSIVKLAGTVEQWNRLFNITLMSDGPDEYHSLDQPTIPAEIIDNVDCVLGLSALDILSRVRVMATGGGGTSVPLNPQEVAAVYNFPSGDGYGGCIGLIELGGGATGTNGGFTTQNVDSTFQTQQGLSYTPNVIMYPVNGGINTPTGAYSLEYMLDVAVAGGICPRADIVIYAAPFGSFTGFAESILAAVNDTVNYPSVLSISYALNENFLLVYAPSMLTAVDSALQSAAVLGISVFAATGDQGSYSNTLIPAGYELCAEYPATSPYVTAVGGTTLNVSGGVIDSETVWEGSGGGISGHYSTSPSWQTGLSYKEYPSGTVTSLAARGIPDIASNSDPASGYLFYAYGTNTYSLAAGTSAAAPLWAALVCLLNVNSNSRMGFVNSLLYSNSGVLSDITAGNNMFAGAPVYAASGYEATTGWDACTGLGRPVGTSIYELIHLGQTYPKQNYGFRNRTTSSYPRVDNGSGRQVTITPINLIIRPLSSGVLVVGTAISVWPTANGGQSPYAYSVSGSLPTGLSINSTTGCISGTPTTVQTSTFTLIATDSLGNTGSQSVPFTVS
jgi:kumamolisin